MKYVGFLRNIRSFNKLNKSLGVTNSVSYNYDNLCVLSFKSDKEEEILMALLDAGIEPVEFENEDGFINVEVKYNDNIKTIIENSTKLNLSITFIFYSSPSSFSSVVFTPCTCTFTSNTFNPVIFSTDFFTLV